jgi:hypothetical protein
MILGTREKDYYIQTNNAKYPLLTCGFTSAVGGLSICGYDLSKIPGTEKQPEDKLTAIAMTESNWPEYSEYLQKVRNVQIDFLQIFKNTTPPYEFPQLITYIINKIFGEYSTIFRYGWNSFEKIKQEIDRGNTVIICGNFTLSGHYVLVCGYEDNSILIINDSYPPNYNSGDGYNKSYVQLTNRTLLKNPDMRGKMEEIKIDSYQILITKKRLYE